MKRGGTGTQAPETRKSAPLLDPSFETLNLLLEQLSHRYNLDPSDVAGFFKGWFEDQRQGQIPAELFAERSMGVLETLTRYLKDHNGLSFKEISGLLNRDSRTIWTSYHKALGKSSSLPIPKHPTHMIPAKTFADRSLGPTECLIRFLRDREGLGYTQIARLIHRDPRTIWAAYHHAQRKEKKGDAR